EAAARSAVQAGMAVAMGAPNALRGRSYSGNLSARQTHALGLLGMLAADYHPASILPAMGEYAAMLDAIRDGAVKPERAEIPEDPQERAEHLKAFGHYCDASMVGICALPDAARLQTPFVNPGVATLAEALRTKQTKTLAAGIDVIMAELKEAASRPLAPLGAHRFALVFLYEHPRDPVRDEDGCEWILNAQAQRSADGAQATADEALRRANAALAEDDLFCETRVINNSDVGTCAEGFTVMSCSQTRYTIRAGGLSFLREIDNEQCRFNARVLEMHVRCCAAATSASTTAMLSLPGATR
ncbi:MAG: hypothetical protein AAFR44_03960, partial [Pseudomonadota bacterium]